MSKSSNAAEVTKSDRRTSKTTLQEEIDNEDVVVALSGKPELSFHPEIYRQLQVTP
jgi:hypothetical protein